MNLDDMSSSDSDSHHEQSQPQPQPQSQSQSQSQSPIANHTSNNRSSQDARIGPATSNTNNDTTKRKEVRFTPPLTANLADFENNPSPLSSSSSLNTGLNVSSTQDSSIDDHHG